MNSFKKLTAVFLAVLMLIPPAVIGVYADTDAERLTVNVSSNYCPSSTNTYNLSDENTVFIGFNLRSEYPISNIQGYFTYDSSVLRLDGFELDSQFPSPVYNTELYNMVTFNSTNTDNSVDFATEGIFASARFSILSAGETSITLNIEELNSLSQEFNRVPIISDSVVADSGKTGGSIGFDEPQPPTEPVNPSSDTKVTVKTSAKKIYVNGKATVKADVKNPVGKTTYKSSNPKVASVNSSTGAVKGKSAGKVSITATNNGESASVKITVVKRKNPMTVKGLKKTVRSSSLKRKAKTVKAVKLKKAKGKLTFKKKSGKKLFTVNKKTGKITVKKGAANGKYTVRIKVTAAGTRAYKKAVKVVKVRITVK